MKKTLTLTLLIFTLFISQNSFSQSKLSFALTGGYLLPEGSLKGDLESFGSSSYKMKDGISFGGAVKYYLDKKKNFQAVLSGGYNMFFNSETDVIGSASKYKMNILAINLGAQYNFMPDQKINLFVNADLTNNFYSGNQTLTFSGSTTTSNLKSTWRGGLQFGAGVDIKASDKLGILVGENFNVANLIGRSTDTTFTEPLVYGLNDKTSSSIGTDTGAKVISYLQFYVGISYFIHR